MARYSTIAVQTVNPGEDIIYQITEIPCNRGLVRHRDGTGSFLLSGWIPNQNGICPCCRKKTANYAVNFGGNVAIPTGETVGAITVGLTIDGSTVPSSIMIVTPAAVEEYWNLSRVLSADIWRGCCETVTIRNLSNIPILVQNTDVNIDRPDLNLTR